MTGRTTGHEAVKQEAAKLTDTPANHMDLNEDKQTATLKTRPLLTNNKLSDIVFFFFSFIAGIAQRVQRQTFWFPYF